MFKQLFLSKKEKTLNKIKKQCAIDLDSSAISNILENEKISKNILKAVKVMNPDDHRMELFAIYGPVRQCYPHWWAQRKSSIY
ncbi:hypothetical protein RclHR1_05260009 [Rhizophagus clarus]|uniref:Uncharacterized protein n=1 Tax=Rhizophagus clarus TaxID=94130 RepID=A0A2Z6SED0_9GLOM|nr:hypothetical protein RclHR1_05260009 [Rhizophagus clarus]